MKWFYGLAFACFISAFSIGCDSSSNTVEGEEGTTPPDVQAQMDAYDKAMKNEQPNAQR